MILVEEVVVVVAALAHVIVIAVLGRKETSVIL